jgi:hypothetical protein
MQKKGIRSLTGAQLSATTYLEARRRLTEMGVCATNSAYRLQRNVTMQCGWWSISTPRHLTAFWLQSLIKLIIK